MAQTFTYPGVYIEEIPSAVHTITGVATPIAAFVGWAPKGPTSKATLVQSFSDFANQFRGLDSRSLLGYSVNQFFGNGGQQAYIVRLVTPDAKIGTIPVPAAGGGLAFTANAIDEGQWSTQYGVRIVQNPSDATRFSLLVVYTPTPNQETTVENFSNLSMLANDPQSRYVGMVINDPRTGSQIIQLTGIASLPGVQPAPNPLATPGLPPSPYMLTGGVDGTVLNPTTPAFHS
jgi:hypothetical protein